MVQQKMNGSAVLQRVLFEHIHQFCVGEIFTRFTAFAGHRHRFYSSIAPLDSVPPTTGISVR